MSGGRRLVGHAVVVALAAVLVSLGFWQLDRLDQRRTANARLTARAGLAPIPAAELIDRPRGDVEHRRVVAEGTYRADGEVLVRFRSLDGLPGYHVVTPLQLDDGRFVLVNRGWVPLAIGDRWPDRSAAAPAGRVRVAGRVSRPEDGALAPSTREGVVRVNRLRSDEIGRRLDLALPDVHLEEIGPEDDDRFPIALPEPDLGDGPHLSYAIQWFAFAAIGVAGWIALVRRSGRTGARRPQAGDNLSTPS